MKYVRKDGQPIILSGSKVKNLYLQRMKSSKLMWTQAWRRLNKKGNDATVARKKTKRTVKMQRAIVGISLETVSFFIVIFGSSFCELDGGFDLEKIVPVVGWYGQDDPNSEKTMNCFFNFFNRGKAQAFFARAETRCCPHLLAAVGGYAREMRDKLR